MNNNLSRYPSASVVFVPQFVIKAIDRAGTSIAKVFTENTADQKLSLNYLAYLFCLDAQVKKKLNISEIDCTVNEYYLTAYNMSNDASVSAELSQLLVSSGEIIAEDTFIIYDTQSSLVCVGIKEGFDLNNETHLLALTKAVIKHWYMYEKQEVVANTELFNTYLKLLSRNR